MVQLEPGHTFAAPTRPQVQSCAICGGHFPGPGVERQGRYYCCDVCVAEDQHRVRMVVSQAAKHLALIVVAAGVGFLRGQAGRREKGAEPNTFRH